jgi:hypothetical protein
MKSRAELYEYHASECVRDAGQTNDSKRRELLLKCAREWRLDIERNLDANCGALEVVRPVKRGAEEEWGVLRRRR